MIRVMIRHPARRWIVLLALVGSVVTASAATAQTSVPMEFPPPGTRWITTLWKVDRASFALMREFYDQLAKLDAVQALQAAQRAAMKEFPHPFAWAAFGLTGVGR
jgi:hypothetical protein